jgi:16S rRNA processing protein RimM
VSTPSDKQSDAEDVVIARIVKARGIRGEVSCVIETSFPDRFSAMEEITVWMPDETRLRLSLEGHWFHKDRVILKFKGYDTMTAAQSLTGGRLVIEESDLEQPGESEFFEYQLIGSKAITSDGRPLGHVTALVRTGGTDLLVVKSEHGPEHLIPFADDICTDVDVRAKLIKIDPPEGLLDL